MSIKHIQRTRLMYIPALRIANVHYSFRKAILSVNICLFVGELSKYTTSMLLFKSFKRPPVAVDFSFMNQQKVVVQPKYAGGCSWKTFARDSKRLIESQLQTVESTSWRKSWLFDWRPLPSRALFKVSAIGHRLNDRKVTQKSNWATTRSNLCLGWPLSSLRNLIYENHRRALSRYQVQINYAELKSENWKISSNSVWYIRYVQFIDSRHVVFCRIGMYT
jgi:hypothetical protein